MIDVQFSETTREQKRSIDVAAISFHLNF